METTNEGLMPYESKMLREFGNRLREIRFAQLDTLIKRGGLISPIYEVIKEMYGVLDTNQN
ncbi:hypothetical protein HYT23_00540 [Candidatus Pacearchaeota archaeon]|nr:hypothetical protein [Candidatus Pacearchaeota archaeon]